MARLVAAILVFLGGNAFAVWLGNMRVAQWLLVSVWSVAFAGAALIAWWPRWTRAYAVFVGGPSKFVEDTAVGLSASDEPVVTAASDLSARYIQGKPFRLVDIPRSNGVIEGRTFENCTIYGPAIVLLLGSSFVACGWDTANSEPRTILWRSSHHMVVGAIGLKNCMFRNCEFKSIGVGGDKATLERFVRDVTGKAFDLDAYKP